MTPRSLERARAALRGPGFRVLLGARLVSTLGDGLFQAALVTSVVFSPQRQGTVAGFAIATAIVVLPYSIVEPFAGVFIDRWPRRRILLVAPLVRAALVLPVLATAADAPPGFYVGALAVLSLNRLYLATGTAVLPRLVPEEDLLVANSLATTGGTVALLAGVLLGGIAAAGFGPGPPLVAAASTWALASTLAIGLPGDLRPARRATQHLRHVAFELLDGGRRLVRTPTALAPIASMAVDQLGQGLVLVLSLFVLRDRFHEGVESFSVLIGVGGAGVLVGLITVGPLEGRLSRPRIIAAGFSLGGGVLILLSTHITGWTVLVASFAVGIGFSWKKVAADTMVQEAVPDEYRGRIMSVYDVCYQSSRLVAAVLAVAMVPALGAAGSVAAVGITFLLWTPVVPRWLGAKRHRAPTPTDAAGGADGART
jgi:MFS family permease